MAQRDSGYARIARDAYETPEWVTMALARWLKAHDVLVGSDIVWEPAAGSGKMVRALESENFQVVASDIDASRMAGADEFDFVTGDRPPRGTFGCDAIITNPPYAEADAFVRRALDAMQPDGTVAMLLPLAWDSAKTRRPFFADCPAFYAKLALTSRITWFERAPEPGKKEHGPSEQHAWFVWTWRRAAQAPRYDWLHMPDAEAKALRDRKRSRSRISAANTLPAVGDPS